MSDYPLNKCQAYLRFWGHIFSFQKIVLLARPTADNVVVRIIFKGGKLLAVSSPKPVSSPLYYFRHIFLILDIFHDIQE